MKLRATRMKILKPVTWTRRTVTWTMRKIVMEMRLGTMRMIVMDNMEAAADPIYFFKNSFTYLFFTIIYEHYINLIQIS